MDSINSIQEVFDSFKSYSSAIRNLSLDSIESIITSVKLFLKFMNGYKFYYDSADEITLSDLRTISNNDIYSYIFDLAERSCLSATRVTRIEHIKTFFTYLFKIKHTLFAHPISNIKVEKKLKKQIPNYLSLEDAKKMRDLYRQSDKVHEIRTNAIINLCLNSGLRVKEIIELKISDINFKENSFIIQGKGNKERMGYLNELTKQSVLKYLEIRNQITPANKKDKDILFLGRNNCRLNDAAVRAFIKISYTKAGIDNKNYSIHTLRHTCATLLYKSGTNIRTIQELLGHTNLTTTTIYTHVHDENVKKSMLDSPLAHFSMQEALNY